MFLRYRGNESESWLGRYMRCKNLWQKKRRKKRHAERRDSLGYVADIGPHEQPQWHVPGLSVYMCQQHMNSDLNQKCLTYSNA